MTSLNDYAERIHKIAIEHGFHETDRNFGEMVALMHSELSEALEAHRAGKANVYVILDGKPEGVAVELIDCLIRILDTLASMDVDIDQVAAQKIAYNATRPFKHGKAY